MPAWYSRTHALTFKPAVIIARKYILDKKAGFKFAFNFFDDFAGNHLRERRSPKILLIFSAVISSASASKME